MAPPKKNPAKTTIRMGLVGPGFIAAQHIDAVRRLGNVEIAAIAGSNIASARRKAREWHVPRASGDYRELTDDPGIDVIHNTTPNHLHFDVSMAALRACKHVVNTCATFCFLGWLSHVHCRRIWLAWNALEVRANLREGVGSFEVTNEHERCVVWGVVHLEEFGDVFDSRSVQVVH